MKNKNIKNSQQGHHDDCQDCRRQKKQNQALLAIYQRLQAVDNNSKLMRKSLEKHQQECQKTSSKFNDFVTKFNNAPKESRVDVQIKNVGFQLAESTLFEMTKGIVARQNQRLKRTLARMYKNKNDGTFRNLLDRRSQSVSTDYEIPEENKNKVNDRNVEIRKTSLKSYDIDLKKSMPIQQIKQVREPQQTRTTGFFSHQNKPNKISGLNLWLYEGENKSLQEQLYETRVLPKIKLQKKGRQRGSVLPALRTTRYKK